MAAWASLGCAPVGALLQYARPGREWGQSLLSGKLKHTTSSVVPQAQLHALSALVPEDAHLDCNYGLGD